MKPITCLLVSVSLFSFAFAEPTNEFDDDSDDFLVESELQEISQDLKDAATEEDEFFTHLQQAIKTVDPVKEESVAAKTAPTVEQKEVAVAPVPAPVTAAKKEIPVQPKTKVNKPAAKIAPSSAIQINFDQVFSGSPIIYSVLFLLSIVSLFIWLYAQTSIRSLGAVTNPVLTNLKNQLSSNQYEEALALCQKHNNFFCRMVSSGILSRSHGLHAITDVMKAEGKRATVGYWQKIALLNDIAILAPMIGLLGTVLGMFYAFYDLNRSMESIAGLFDGLGISVGTTVAGLVVAILAMFLHSISKYRLTRVLSGVENEAYALATLIDQKTFVPKAK